MALQKAIHDPERATQILRDLISLEEYSVTSVRDAVKAVGYEALSHAITVIDAAIYTSR